MKQVKLSEFLKENGAYDKFVENFNKSYFNIEKRGNTRIKISNCCCWEDSEEGFNYWIKLDDKWQELDDDLKVYDMDWLLEDIRKKDIEIDKELFSKCWNIPLDIISDLKCNIEWDEINYYDLEDEVYDMDWLLNDKQGESLISNISVIYNHNTGYEALYLDNELIEEGSPLNEGQERVLYFINICDKYNFNIKDIKFGYCVCEEFPLSLLELDDINWEN